MLAMRRLPAVRSAMVIASLAPVLGSGVSARGHTMRVWWPCECTRGLGGCAEGLEIRIATGLHRRMNGLGYSVNHKTPSGSRVRHREQLLRRGLRQPFMPNPV